MGTRGCFSGSKEAGA